MFLIQRRSNPLFQIVILNKKSQGQLAIETMMHGPGSLGRQPIGAAQRAATVALACCAGCSARRKQPSTPPWLQGAAAGWHPTVTAHAAGKACCPLAANGGSWPARCISCRAPLSDCNLSSCGLHSDILPRVPRAALLWLLRVPWANLSGHSCALILMAGCACLLMLLWQLICTLVRAPSTGCLPSLLAAPRGQLLRGGAGRCRLPLLWSKS